MTERGMEHLDHLWSVAVEDLAELKRKEATYRGSWKRRGGVGAFMMLARKWDRLEGIVSELGRFGGGDLDAHPFDVFGWIEAECRSASYQIGRDGTVLAELRDLRRYLLLVEAEMVARGVVPRALPQTEPGPVPAEDSNRHALDQFTEPNEPGRESLTFAQLKDEELARIHAGSGREPRPSGSVHPAAPPVQGGASEPEVPEALRPVPLGDAHDQDGIVDIAYAQAGQLPKRVVAVGASHEEAAASGRVWAIVDRSLVEDDYALLHLPRLRREVNSTELEDVAPYYRHMYRWDEGRQTHSVKPVYERWTKTGHQ